MGNYQSDYATNASRILLENADAQARAISNKGVILGNTMQSLAQLPTVFMQMKQQVQAGQQADAERQAEQRLRDLFASNPKPNPGQIISIVGPQRGIPIVNGLAALKVDPQGDFEKTQKVLRNVLLGMKALPEGLRAESYPGVRQTLVQRGVIPDDEGIAPRQYDEGWFDRTVSFGQEPAPKPDYTLGHQRFSGETNHPIAEGQPSTAQGPQVGSFEDYVIRIAKAKGISLAELAPGDIEAARRGYDLQRGPDSASLGSFEDYVGRYAADKGKTPDTLTRADIEDARKRYMQADDVAAGARAADITRLSASGLDMAALNYRKTGIMPPLGMGDRSTRQQIINRAAELTPQDIQRIEAGGTDLAGNKADFGANSQSLTALTKQRDAISAFERTAQKNIDIFLETAGKVVDTGSPLMNTPARVLSGKVLGSANQAEYDAARQVAISEIAKIVQNPNLTGQLSDAARHEIEVFNPSNATLKQTVAVMRLLKRDMANRAQSLDEQIAATRGRIGGGNRAAPLRRAIPGIQGGLAESTDGGKTWTRVQ